MVFEAYYKSDVSDLQGIANNFVSKFSGGNSFSLFKSSNDFKVMTLDNFQRSAEGRWATHEIIGIENKPLKEFLGPGLEDHILYFSFRRSVGVTPEKELEKLRKLRDGGVVCDFVLGSTPVTRK